MDIIKPGKPPGDKKRTSTCPSCGCKFTHTLAETEMVYDQRDGDFRWVKCPQQGCRNKFTISP